MLELSPDEYEHLKALAERIFRKRGWAHGSIQPTILLNEAWLKLSESTSTYQSRAHFMAVASRAMRQILIDRARAQRTAKRGGDLRRTTLSGVGIGSDDLVDLLSLEAALLELEALDPDCARVVILRAFGGLTMAEIAEVTGVSVSSIERSWRFARSWLQRRMA